LDFFHLKIEIRIFDRMPSFISFQHVSKVFPPNTIALEDVSFELEKGEFLSIVGRSGAGKTTLLKILAGAEYPTTGYVYFDGENVHALPPRGVAHVRRRMGIVFQDYRLLPSRTVQENIAYVLEAAGLGDEEIEQEVRQVLELVGLEQRKDHFPHELSGGEHQRAALARALVHRPEVLLADEPTGNLDPYQTRDVVKLLLKVNELGATVILATHNKGIVNSIKKRVLTLEKGRAIRDERVGKFVL
jgi:cell division transport system ATP-binding protein